jgi:hypothetical protein
MSSATTVDFPVAEVFDKAWGRLLENIGAFVPAMLVIAAVSFGAYVTGLLVGLVMGAILGDLMGGNLAYLVNFLLNAALGGPLMLGLFSMARRVSIGQSVAWNDVFSGFDHFQTAAMASGLYSLMVAIGILLCVLPGLVVSFLYCLTWIRLMEGESGAWQAMESGRRMVMDNLVSWLILYPLLFVINGLGMIPCFLGLFITVPFTALVLTDAHARQINRV